MYRYRIAIVDDNEDWCFILAARLEQEGYTATTFSNPDVFLSQAEAFDLALIDFSMPPRPFQRIQDGPDLVAKLRQQIEHPPLLILISAYFTQDILRQTADLEMQADTYLSKTTDSAELLTQIKQLLASRSSARAQGKSEPQQSERRTLESYYSQREPWRLSARPEAANRSGKRRN